MRLASTLNGAAVASLLFTSVAAADTVQLRMLTGFPMNHMLTTGIAGEFVDSIKSDPNAPISIQLNGPEVVPGFEQLEPVGAGIFDMVLTHGAYHTGTTMVGMSIDAVVAEPKARRESGAWDLFDEYYRQFNLKLVAIPTVPGYHFMLREPIGSDGGLEGLRIRGTLTYHGVIEDFGGIPTVMPVPEIYPSLERGVIDGTAHTIYGNQSLRLYEVAPYMTRPGFGVTSTLLFVNLDRFDDLTEEQQAYLLEMGRELEETVAVSFAEALEAEERELVEKHGVTITEFSPDKAARIETVFRQFLWNKAIEDGGAEAQALYDKLREADMTD